MHSFRANYLPFVASRLNYNAPIQPTNYKHFRAYTTRFKVTVLSMALKRDFAVLLSLTENKLSKEYTLIKKKAVLINRLDE